ncbi:pDDEXK-like protein of unknown function [Terrimicrobium sacchariphilum]|uniref:Putative exodeoxyribonuclease 8 PDDEXK-like domain-containing protein n=1 Tax=Terrimicrobium sacchariphilum TaxID=690879 RepID=A0A146GG86_TERSA|nr:PD-(D/E)XK nuclease-like domain-containing protein [Terrimicrobium sacchariphilum]GAT35597.1 pDDEXK-like protein of unknown function [Terrimicrobium sacchariphilum]
MKAFPYLAQGEPLDLGPGILRGLSREQYDRLPSINQSTLKKWIEIVMVGGGCPRKFKHWFDTRNDGEKTEGLLLGSALDCLILEPGAFESKFAVAPAGLNLRTNAGKAAMEAFESANAGKDILTAKQEQTVLAMREALEKDEKTTDVWKYCQKAVLQAEIEGYPCKGEVDLFSNNTEYLFDLKTSRDASGKAFGKSAWDLGYHIQAAFYLMLCSALGLKKSSFSFVVVENTAPYCVAAYTLDWTSDAMQYARKLITEAMPQFAYHFTRNQWPDFSDFEPIKFPKYSRGEIVDFLGTSL